jgi:beta-lactam-binding protein with PASTA domain
MSAFRFPSTVTGRKGTLAVLEVEFSTKARRVRVLGFDGLEPLDVRGEAPGGTYEASEDLARLNVPMRVTKDGERRGTVRVTVEDEDGVLPPQTWSHEVELEAPRPRGALVAKVLLLLGLAAVGALIVVLVVMPALRDKPLPNLLRKPLAEAERVLASNQWGAVVKYQAVSDPAQEGLVLGTAPGFGERLERGRVVEVTVGRYVAGTPAPASVPPTPPPPPPPTSAMETSPMESPPAPPPAESHGGGETTPTVEVPALVGSSEEDVNAALSGTGLTFRVSRVDAPAEQDGKVVRQEPEARKRVPPGTAIEVFVGRGPREAPPAPPPMPPPAATSARDVPDVVGWKRDEAEKTLRDSGFAAHVVEEDAPPENVGRVLRQAPAAGGKAAEGSPVEVAVGRESGTPPSPPPTPPPAPPPTPMTEPRPAPARAAAVVPDVLGRSRAEAEDLLARAGLTARVVLAPAAREADGKVLGLSSSAGTTLFAGDVVEVTVGMAEAAPPPPTSARTTPAPDVLGLSVEEARAGASKAGLAVRESFEDVGEDVHDGIVLRQTPSAGEAMPAGGTLELVVSRHAAPPPTARTTTIVPVVAGRAVDDAVAALFAAGLLADVVGDLDPQGPYGLVRAQEPAATSTVRPGSRVRLEVPVAPAADGEAVEVPDVTGTLPAEARLRLEALGHRVRVPPAYAAADAPAWATPGKVLAQWPRGRVRKTDAATVTLWAVGP